jgi:hypothetical protein
VIGFAFPSYRPIASSLSGLFSEETTLPDQQKDNFSDAFDAPVTEVIGGEPVSFPRPTIDELAAWADQIHAARKATAQRLMPKDVTPVERYQILSAVEHDAPGLDAVAGQLYGVKGARKLFRDSLAKAGKTRQEADAIIARIPPFDFTRLAQRVSGLFKFRDEGEGERKDDAKGAPDPNAPEAGE